MPIDFVYPNDEKVWGPDVSFYQDEDETPRGIDFNKMKEEGADFVFIRAGQWNWIDPDFQTNWSAAKEAGLLRGAYWFLDARGSANSQANLFRSLLAPDPGELRPVVDFEHETSHLVKDKRGKTKSSKLFLSTQQLYGFLQTLNWPVKPIIYTGYYYWQDHGSKDPAFADHPLWLAQYRVEKPQIPAPWKTWLFWQFTETGPGKVLGAESNAIDLNYFNGSKDQLLKFAGKSVDIPVPTNTTDPTVHGKTTVTLTWIDADGQHRTETTEVEF